jgi:nucleotide-binding universal stress UspA family protein
MTQENSHTPLVVVGVDGSACSHDALRFAANEARLRGGRLSIVTAWNVPVMVYAGGYTAGIDPGTFKHDAEAVSVAALEEARGIAADVEIEATVTNDQPASALIAAAEDADLLVVGSRGLGGFSRLLLGSVSEQVAHHAQCPLSIVRSSE